MTRRPALVKVQIARRDLGLDDVVYREMLERITGRASSADCTDAELGRVLDELKAKGWSPRVIRGGRTTAAPARKAAQSPMAKKARAMWISLHQLGEVRDPSESALEAFGRRQLGVDRLQWADQSQAYRLIEALKAMATRAGWDQSDGDPRALKEALHLAQAKRLYADDPTMLEIARIFTPRMTDRNLANAIAFDAEVIWSKAR